MTNRTDIRRRPVLDEVEARLPIPDDVLVTEENTLPSGNAWWVPTHRVILVRPGLGQVQRNFTLAHETAHIILGHHGGMARQRDIEGEADKLAAVLLLGAAVEPGRRRAIRRVLAAHGVKVPA
jgi:Zn-dependent peptidase ImmA (M78 family)